MKSNKNKTFKRVRRHKRIRAKVFGTAARPRLSVFRSNKQTYAQLIDDESGITLAAARSAEVKGKNPLTRAHDTGKLVAERAAKKKIKKVVFDRGGFVYAGKVKALAEGVREGGVSF